MQKTVHDKAIRLIEGGNVEIDGIWFYLARFPVCFDGNPCMECDLDSICKMEHSDVCETCEAILHRKCCLRLAHTRRKQ